MVHNMFPLTNEQSKTHAAASPGLVRDTQLVPGFMNCTVFEGTKGHVALQISASELGTTPGYAE